MRVREERVAVGMGSNVGDRWRHLCLALERMRTLLSELRVSSVYETEPLHVTDQARFLNLCCVGCTTLSPLALLDALQAVESAAGRLREQGGPRFGPRTLDLDLLLFGDRIVRKPGLTVPHPRMQERAFVLVPLAEIAGDWQVAGTGLTVQDLRSRVGDGGVRPYEEGEA